MSEKKIPMDSELPALSRVPAIPDVEPRWFAGTLFIIAVRLGALNNPEPIPLSPVGAANSP